MNTRSVIIDSKHISTMTQHVQTLIYCSILFLDQYLLRTEITYKTQLQFWVRVSVIQSALHRAKIIKALSLKEKQRKKYKALQLEFWDAMCVNREEINNYMREMQFQMNVYLEVRFNEWKEKTRGRQGKASSFEINHL